jgi:hypothetical protein
LLLQLRGDWSDVVPIAPFGRRHSSNCRVVAHDFVHSISLLRYGKTYGKYKKKAQARNSC